LRVFLDTNVLVSAFATRGLCADLFRMVLSEHELLLSPTVIAELTRTLSEKIRLPEQTVRDVVALVSASATLLAEPAHVPPLAVRDPDDAVILGEALASQAEVLITGDKDLLELGDIPRLRILDPRGFWHLLRAQRPVE
jgi:putative PIN family toxin of toxin-antitoxin system